MTGEGYMVGPCWERNLWKDRSLLKRLLSDQLWYSVEMEPGNERNQLRQELSRSMRCLWELGQFRPEVSLLFFSIGSQGRGSSIVQPGGVNEMPL